MKNIAIILYKKNFIAIILYLKAFINIVKIYIFEKIINIKDNKDNFNDNLKIYNKIYYLTRNNWIFYTKIKEIFLNLN